MFDCQCNVYSFVSLKEIILLLENVYMDALNLIHAMNYAHDKNNNARALTH